MYYCIVIVFKNKQKKLIMTIFISMIMNLYCKEAYWTKTIQPITSKRK